MNIFKVTLILGTRPEAIKLAPVIKEFQKHNTFKLRVITTGQHKEMVDSVISLFQIKVDYDLNIMSSGQTLTYITNAVLKGLEEEFKRNKPNLIIVQGDTSTAFTSALAAFYEKIPVAHVEAGLRTDNFYMPFPEEANRRLISEITSLHFAPTIRAQKNLKDSKVLGKVFLTGNTVIDALKIITNKTSPVYFDRINWKKNRVILSTIHRRENWGNNIEIFAKAVINILEKHHDCILLLPMHRNKLVRDPLIGFLGNHKQVVLVEPLDYIDFISTLKECYLVLTDSGGLQEEATALGKPVLILRETTERQEAVEAGGAKLIGNSFSKIVQEVETLLDKDEIYESMCNSKNPFGDGYASERIVKHCVKFLEN